MEWKPIETAPKDGTQIMICGQTADGAWVFGTGSWRDNLGEVAERGTLITGYSHWAAMPEPPSNARGKPRRSAKHGGHPQAELAGVGLTNQLGDAAAHGLFLMPYLVDRLL